LFVFFFFVQNQTKKNSKKKQIKKKKKKQKKEIKVEQKRKAKFAMLQFLPQTAKAIRGNGLYCRANTKISKEIFVWSISHFTHRY
jgi:hypothetical protein